MNNIMANTLSIEKFLKRYFTAHQCDFTIDHRGKITVQLTVEMDKVLMNRPFYWQYVEATGKAGEPKKLHFQTNPPLSDEEAREWIHFGSPFVKKIFDHLKNTAKKTLAYEILHVTEKTMLHPWLLTNICLTYEGKQKKEELFSIGLNLINGTIVFDMMEKLAEIDLGATISNYCYTISPLIKITSGFSRIEKYLDNYVLEQEHKWALDSLQLLQEEVDMIHHFYEHRDEADIMEKEITDVVARLQPKITYEVINGGLVYLHDTFIHSVS